MGSILKREILAHGFQTCGHCQQTLDRMNKITSEEVRSQKPEYIEQILDNANLA